MDLARYVGEMVLLEGSSYREVARANGVSKDWAARSLAASVRGWEALAARSRAPSHIPHRTPADVQGRIVALRDELASAELDARTLPRRAHPLLTAT